jgi:hypothetical protein
VADHRVKISRELRLQATILQLVDYLGLEYKDCEKCDGTGDQDSWIPVCQTCYGIGRVLHKPGFWEGKI